MSSDESTSTQLSTFSNADGKKDKLKPHKSEPWEINLIGTFLLDLYHRSIIGHHNEWCIRKFEIRKAYSTYITEDLSKKLYELNGTADIGTLLHRCGFLINTPRGSSFFKIRFSSLFDFRNNKLKELDNLKLNSDGETKKSDFFLLNLTENKSNILVEDYEVDENEESKSLEYQGTFIRRRLEDYHPTNMSCCICQEDFTTIETYEEHIQKHGEDTDFEFLTTMDKLSTPLFKIKYKLCKNSHYFCFEIETDAYDLIIEKIIIVQSRSFYYVHNMRVPYKCPENGTDRFFVDSHLFTIHVEQPIVLIFHRENYKETRIIEQHHFMRSEEFPKVNFSINPYRLPNKKLFKSKFSLADYFPPKEIQEALKDDFYYEKLMKTCNEFRDYVRNGKKLQPHNIGSSLNILLQIEDMDTILQYVGLTQKNIKLRSYGDEYSFRLKPKQRIFIENILSPNDEVVLTLRTDIFTNNKEIMELILQNKSDIERMKNTFVGIIQAVNTGRISFKCNKKINMKAQYTVICRPSRLNLRHQYRSLELLPVNIDFLKKFLFPSKIIPKPLSNAILRLYNPNISGEQLQAVRNIAEGPRNDATYIIFGPPGTGKTTTIVEGILQVLRKPNTKILVTASSNSACDEIAKRLCKYLRDLDIKRAMVRIYSRSSEIRTETIDDELLENSNMYNGQFYPDIEILHEYRIVVCTLSVVAKLITGKFGRQENGTTLYSHLFIDEVAATTEAEALIGITTILTPQSCLIISGDHKQLGPILQSKRAEELGLGVSLMDRLLARDCYRVDVDTNDYDRTIQTRLIRNYRSHPEIVNLYSALYYNHSLEAHAKKDEVSLSEIWHKSRNKQFPIMFHAIYEPSRSDNQSHSLYNLCELNVVMDYIKDFMYFGINGKPVKESDIGIISPYQKQFKRIQEELNLRKWFGIETGSVETFQGKEKDIIIVSFVRSGTKNLGFLDNPRRLNVTISRPKSLLILIGNPQTLSLNSDFEYIIKECQRNNTFVGSNKPKTDDFKKPLAGNMKSENQLSGLNKSLQALNIEEKDKEKNVEKSKIETNETMMKKRSRRRNGKNKLNKNDENSNEKKDEKNVNESLNNDGKNDDDDDEEEDSESDDDDEDQSDQTSKSKNKTKSRKNLGRGGNNNRKLNKKSAGNDGKISKKYGKGKQKITTDNSKKSDKSKFDSLLDELPRVPTSQSSTIGTTANFTNPELLQEQQQFRKNFQQQPQSYNVQQQHHFNNLQKPLHHNSLEQQQQQFINYNNSNLNYAAGKIPFLHPAPAVYQNYMVQQPQPTNAYVTSFGNPNVLSYPVANHCVSRYNNPISSNNPAQNIVGSDMNCRRDMNATTSKTERKNENESNKNRSKAFNKNITPNVKKNDNKRNSQNPKGNKTSNSENTTKKSSKVAANIHGTSTNKNDNSSQGNKNNKSFAGDSNTTIMTKKPVFSTPQNTANENKSKKSAKPNNNINQNRTNNSENAAKPLAFVSSTNTPKSSVNENKTSNSAVKTYSFDLSTNSTSQNFNRNVDKPSTSDNIYPTLSYAVNSSTVSNLPTSSITADYNPPTNPYLSSYSPSAPFVNHNNFQSTTSSGRPIRQLSFENKSKGKKECIIS